MGFNIFKPKFSDNKFKIDSFDKCKTLSREDYLGRACGLKATKWYDGTFFVGNMVDGEKNGFGYYYSQEYSLFANFNGWDDSGIEICWDETNLIFRKKVNGKIVGTEYILEQGEKIKVNHYKNKRIIESGYIDYVVEENILYFPKEIIIAGPIQYFRNLRKDGDVYGPAEFKDGLCAVLMKDVESVFYSDEESIDYHHFVFEKHIYNGFNHFLLGDAIKESYNIRYHYDEEEKCIDIYVRKGTTQEFTCYSYYEDGDLLIENLDFNFDCKNRVQFNHNDIISDDE